MRAFHVICGTPRSGSTLLCNILGQNPDFTASTTSPLCQIFGAAADAASIDDATRAQMLLDSEKTTDTLQRTLRGILENWYFDEVADVIFDKGRGWPRYWDAVHSISPNSRALCVVRDPVEIVRSCEKRHRASGYLTNGTMQERLQLQLADDGLIGAPIRAIEDALKREQKGFVIVRYEDLIAQTKKELYGIYESIGEDLYDHDLADIPNDHAEKDALWYNKFPHNTASEITFPSDKTKYFDDAIAQDIRATFPYFCQRLNYSK